MSDILKDLDFYHLDDLIGPEEKMTRDAVRHFVQREIIPYVERHFANECSDLTSQRFAWGPFKANIN